MKQRLTAVALLLALFAIPARADRRYIVRDVLGLTALTSTCPLVGCTVVRGLGDPLGQLFLVTTPDLLDPLSFVTRLLALLGVVHVEVDQLAALEQGIAVEIPEALYDDRSRTYYGATVRNGYVDQPASDIIRLEQTHAKLGSTGGGVVAIIDTGIDPDHPVYQSALVAGYDFTRNTAGGSEMTDVEQRTAVVLEDAAPAFVDQRTVAVLEQRTVAVLESPDLEAFGHGTMVAGIVHLVAPDAQILPLKAFKANGAGYTSDIIRAIHHAVSRKAKVINMSFSLAAPSTELRKATELATSKKVICVSAAGNDGSSRLVYPAALANVTGVASTSDVDARSSFSNHGTQLVWVAAPGEGVVTTYPWSTYAAAWGTSFSTPMVAGAAALMADVSTSVDQKEADAALSRAVYLSPELNHGRLDLYQTVQAWRQALGLN